MSENGWSSPVSEKSGPPDLSKEMLLERIAMLEAKAERSRRRQGELYRSRLALASMISNIPGMVFRCRNNLNWTMIFLSDGCLALTGYDPEDFIEDRKIPFGYLVHPEDRVAGWHKIQAAIKADKPYQRTYRITTASGEVRWVWEQGRGLYSDSGELIALEGFITDISHNKRIEAELKWHKDRFEELVEERTSELSSTNRLLKNSNETLSNILSASPVGILHVEDGTVTWANTQMCRLFGFTEDRDFMGQDISVLFPSKEDFDHIMTLFRQSSPDHTDPFKIDLPLLRKDGSPFLAHFRISSSNPSAPLSRAVVTVSDISWRKKAEEEKLEREKLQVVIEMSGAVCHEMNQPLQVLYMTIDELCHESSCGEELETIKREIGKIRKITSKLMQITHYRTMDYVNGMKIVDIEAGENKEN